MQFSVAHTVTISCLGRSFTKKVDELPDQLGPNSILRQDT